MNICDIIESFLNRTGIRSGFRRYRKPFLILYVYALIVYLPLLLLRLTNDIDGLWNQDDYAAGTWELSIGRWFWPYLDKARFNLSLDPLPGILALALFVTGFMIMAVSYQKVFTPATYTAGFLFLASTAITCQMSHGYMVITFAVSFLLSVLAVRILIPAGPAGWRHILISGILIALMMGAYQANIGTTCLLALAYFMTLLCRRDENPSRDSSGTSADSAAAHPGSRNAAGSAGRALNDALHFALQMLAGIVIGAVLYEALLHLNLSAYGITLSSYQGFSEIGPAYFVTHAGQGILHAYQEVKYFFFTGVFKFNMLETHKVFRLVYLVPAAAAVCYMIRAFRNGIAEGILYTCSLVLVPVFAGSFYLLAPEAETHMQMLVSYSLIIPLFLLGYNEIPLTHSAQKLTDTADRETARTEAEKKALRRETFWGWIKTIAVLAGTFFLIYGAIFMNWTDQYAMYAGRRSTATLAENILAEAQALGQDPLNGEMEIIGVPAESPLFSVKDLYYRANSYAQYGNWSSDVSFSRVSWTAMYRNYLRTNVSFAEGETETSIAALPETAAVPVFPAAGSIQNIYGVTVVRISESAGGAE